MESTTAISPEAVPGRTSPVHHVYIEQKNVDAYLKTGDFPTVIVKELTRVLNPTFPDGSLAIWHPAHSDTGLSAEVGSMLSFTIMSMPFTMSRRLT